MYPVLFRIGSMEVETYGVVAVLSFALMVAFAVREGAAARLDRAVLAMAVGWGTVGSIAGGRLAYVLVNLDFVMRDPLVALAFWEGGLVSVGGLIGMQIGAGAYALKARLPLGTVLDIAALCGALSLSLGRWGCFLAGCDYGTGADGIPWAVVFSDPASLVPAELRGIPLHPVQLYLSAANAAVFATGFVLRRKGEPPGRVFGVAALSYSAARFALELFRGDADRGLWFDGNLSTAQIAVIPWAIVGLAAIVTAGKGPWIRREAENGVAYEFFSMTIWVLHLNTVFLYGV
jgi:phosphatidylglycerol:prolipoprotein diacylglycerol transferase